MLPLLTHRLVVGGGHAARSSTISICVVYEWCRKSHHTPPPLTVLYIVVRAVCLEAVTRITIINILISLLMSVLLVDASRNC
jgi:hypothetical protein